LKRDLPCKNIHYCGKKNCIVLFMPALCSRKLQRHVISACRSIMRSRHSNGKPNLIGTACCRMQCNNSIHMSAAVSHSRHVIVQQQ
jgi:hypothetical protein